MQGCACATTGKEHKFRPMMVESTPPDNSAMSEIGINDQNPDEGGFDADERCKLVLALTTRRYLIVCEACGASAGGFVGKVEDPSDSPKA